MEIQKAPNIITGVPDLRDLFYVAADNEACIYLKRRPDAGRESMIATGALDGDVEGIRVTRGRNRVITVYGYSAGPEHMDVYAPLPNIRIRLRNMVMALVSELEDGKASGQDGEADARKAEAVGIFRALLAEEASVSPKHHEALCGALAHAMDAAVEDRLEAMRGHALCCGVPGPAYDAYVSASRVKKYIRDVLGRTPETE